MIKTRKILAFALSCAMVLTLVQTVPNSKITASAGVTDFDYGPGITWPVEDEFPTFATPAATLDSIDISQTNSGGIKMAMLTLQGLVNREQPRLLVQQDDQEGRHHPDRKDLWPKSMGLRLSKTTIGSYLNLIGKYKDVVKGLVVFDSTTYSVTATKNDNSTDTRSGYKYPDSINLANTIAGVYDYLAVDRATATAITNRFPDIVVKQDLTELGYTYDGNPVTWNISRQRWDTPSTVSPNRVKFYEYMYEHLWKTDLVSKRMIIGLHGNNHICGCRDVAVALKTIVHWLEPKTAAERAILDKFTTTSAESVGTVSGVTYALGWGPEEDSTIKYNTSKGIATVPSDGFENMTVYAGQSKQMDLPAVPAKPTLENKIYVAVAVADGDNAQYNQHVMRMGHQWDSPDRNKLPISWTMSPALYYMAPQMLNYYYKTAGTDALICGPSGIGYTKSMNKGTINSEGNNDTINPFWPDDGYYIPRFGDATNKVFEKTQLNVITVWNAITEAQATTFANSIPSLLGLTAQFRTSRTNSQAYPRYSQTSVYPSSGNIALMALGDNGLGDTHVYQTDGTARAKTSLKDLAGGTLTSPQFRLTQFVPWDVDVSDMYKMMTELNNEHPGKFEFVRADHLFMLINEHNNKPFNVALQKPTTASSTEGTAVAANAVDGSITSGWIAKSGNLNNRLQIDLGDTYDISRYVLKNAETGYFADGTNSKGYKLQVSNDGQTWTNADTVPNNTEDIVYKTLDTPVIGRYVRLDVTDAGSDGIARIQDLEVYGVKAAVNSAQLAPKIAEAKAIVQGDATPATWDALQVAIIAAESATTNEARLSALIAMETAIANLAPDMTELNSAMDLASTQNANDYTTAGWAALTSAHNAAKAVLEKTNPSASEVLAAKNALVAEMGTITLSETTKRIGTEESFTLTAADTNGIAVVWSSSDSAKATVSNGVVTTVAHGEATIVATSIDGKRKAECVLDIQVLAKQVELSKTSELLGLFEAVQLTAAPIPETTTASAVTWSSSNPSVATVSQAGIVSAISLGSTEITATYEGGAVGTCNVEVVTKAMFIDLNRTSVNMSKRETFKKVTFSFYPQNATHKTVNWSSSNTKVATVDKNGNIYGVNPGTATITVSSQKQPDVKNTITVKVTNLVKKINVSPKKLKINVKKSKKIKLTVTPKDATNRKAKWTTSKKSVATVNKNGKVTAKAGGKATIRVKVGGKTAKITVLTTGFFKKGKKQYYYKTGKLIKNKSRYKIGKSFYRIDKKGVCVKR